MYQTVSQRSLGFREAVRWDMPREDLPMNVVERIVRADPWRRTRLHDMRGNLIGLESVTDVPSIALQCVLREAFGRRPIMPWIPGPAIRRLDSLLNRESRVLEFGSGMSTLWFALHCGFVHSVEQDVEWHARVTSELRARNLTNVRLDLRLSEAEYGFAGDYLIGSFDLVVVDGAFRPTTALTALHALKAGGAVYMDNTDFGAQWHYYADAEKILLEAAVRDGALFTYYSGFPPATLTANQGLLVEWPPAVSPSCKAPLADVVLQEGVNSELA